MSLDRSTIWPYDERRAGARSTTRATASPTVVEAEAALGELDGGHALLYPSGTGAATSLALALLQPGDTIALAEGCYFGTGVTFQALERWGLRHVEFDQTKAPPEDVQLVWLEAPSNPFLTMPDLEAAAAHPAPVVVDSTVATPVHLRPLEHGADFVLHSATKYLAGHDDALLGAVVVQGRGDCDGAAPLPHRHGHRRRARSRVAPAARPEDARGARRTARRRRPACSPSGCAAIPHVETVRWPGFGGLISFDVADGEAARAGRDGDALIVNATSLGGVTSVMESRARWEGDRVPPGLLRLSVGLEDPDALWGDLAAALG